MPVQEQIKPQKTTVRVVMATFNGQTFLEEQLQSILQNKMPSDISFSVAVYDDASKDDSCKITEHWIQKYPNIFLHSNKQNIGFIKNFLTGLAASNADYTFLADQDDIWHHQKIENSLNAMRRAEERLGKETPIVLFSDAAILNDNSKKIEHSFILKNHLNATKTNFAALLTENKCLGCTMMVNRAVYPYLKSFPDDIRSHDHWLALIGACFGHVEFLNQETLLYRQHSKNAIGSKNNWHYLIDNSFGISKIKKSFSENFKQAKAFSRTFEKELRKQPKNQQILSAFYNLERETFFQKRRQTIRYGFWKSGFLRNLALLLFL